MIERVVIDPGHGGIGPDGYTTAGKRYSFNDGRVVYEGARMRVLARILADLLLGAGVEVIDSLTGREVDGSWEPTFVDTPLRTRVAHANRLPKIPGLTLFLSLHSNAISNSSSGSGQRRARGISVYTSQGTTKSDAIAAAIWREFAEADLLPMRADRHHDGDPDYEAGFYVLRKTSCPAVLLELGFHDHPDDASFLLDEGCLAVAAETIARSIYCYGSGR